MFFFPAWKLKVCVKRVFGLFWVFSRTKNRFHAHFFHFLHAHFFAFTGAFLKFFELSRALFWFHAHFFIIWFFHGDFFPFHGHFFRFFWRKYFFSRSKKKTLLTVSVFKTPNTFPIPIQCKMRSNRPLWSYFRKLLPWDKTLSRIQQGPHLMFFWNPKHRFLTQ